jgi:hypothetical protein
MNSRDELLALYEQWRLLSLREGQSIDAENWVEVQYCQDAKFALQQKILLITQRVEAELASDEATKSEFEAHLKRVIGYLITLEHENSDKLSRKRASAEIKQSRFNQAARKLKQIRTLVSSGDNDLWSSYS